MYYNKSIIYVYIYIGAYSVKYVYKEQQRDLELSAVENVEIYIWTSASVTKYYYLKRKSTYSTGFNGKEQKVSA